MIIVRLAGGLGNQLFQYAFGRALAHRHGVPLKVDRHLLDQQPYWSSMTPRAYSLDLFRASIESACSAEIARYVPFVNCHPESRLGWYAQRLVRKAGQLINPRYIIEKDATTFDEALLATAPPVCYVAGYWQSERYFDSIRDRLRSELRFANPLTGQAAKLAAEMQTVEAVCVHVRRTDFLTDPHQTTLTTSQIQQGVRAVEHRDLTPTLFVFSDDIDWCRQYVRVPGVSVHYVTDKEIGPDTGVHFQLMTHCRHFILSVSTFSWWASWLARHPNQLVLHPPHPRSKAWAAQGWVPLVAA